MFSGPEGRVLRRLSLRIIRVVGFLFLVCISSVGLSQVRVTIGPTPIPGGMATGNRDLTLSNGLLVVSFSVDSAPPWGIPIGGIVDAATLTQGKPDRDQVALVDFLPGGWSAWEQPEASVELTRVSDDEAVVLSKRTLGDLSMRVTTTIRVNDPVIALEATLSLSSAATKEFQAQGGFTLCPEHGRIWLPPADTGTAWAGFRNLAVALQAGRTVGLLTENAERIKGDATWRIFLESLRLRPGESVSYRGWMRLEKVATPMGMVELAVRQSHVPVGAVFGNVSEEGALLQPGSVVALFREGRLAGWTDVEDGAFFLELPEGPWSLVVVSPRQGASSALDIQVDAGRCLFAETEAPRPSGKVRLQIRDEKSGLPLPARVEWSEGPGDAIYAQSLAFASGSPGEIVDLALPSGRRHLKVSHASGFLAEPLHIDVDLLPGQTRELPVRIPRLEVPGGRWTFVDLHHHSNVLDGRTSPEDLVASQLAAGLDVIVVTDHDSVASHRAVSQLALQRGKMFLPGIEVSPSWAHSNLWPLPLGRLPNLDFSTVSPSGIRKAAVEAGALVQLNHPYDDGNAWYRSLEQGWVPERPAEPWFDLIELNGDGGFDRADELTVAKARELWNEGFHIPLSGGSDTHEVRNPEGERRSGVPRTAVATEPTVSIDEFKSALRLGRSYVTFGPLMDAAPEFGTVLKAETNGVVAWHLRGTSVVGISRVEVVCNGEIVFEEHTASARTSWSQTVEVPARTNGWCQFVVTDVSGSPAFSNPIWFSI